MGALRLLPIEAPNEILGSSTRALMGAPKGATMELLKVVPYKLHLRAPK